MKMSDNVMCNDLHSIMLRCWTGQVAIHNGPVKTLWNCKSCLGGSMEGVTRPRVLFSPSDSSKISPSHSDGLIGGGMRVQRGVQHPSPKREQ